MGWFDESDDDDEEEAKLEVAKNDAKDDSDEDPLDAYMKGLEQEHQLQEQKPRAPRAERLDVEGIEEATSHWEQQPKQSVADDIEDKDVQLEMNNTFHRASDSKKQNELTLERIQHDEVKYRQFDKSFWTYSDTRGGHEWRREHDVTCSLSIDPVSSVNGSEDVRNLFGPTLTQVLEKKSLTNFTTVQCQTLPVALSGHDAIITASTGSGKTLAYVWPMVIHINQNPLPDSDDDIVGPAGLVLVPTRELALQVYKQCKIMLQPLRKKSVSVTGGTPKYQLVQELKASGGLVHVVVATPGRLLDVLGVKKKNGMTLKYVTFVVLDEADKMLSMGFEAQVSQILQNIRPDRQTLLLSATMGRKVENVARTWLRKDAVRISVGRTGESSEHVDQHVMVLPSFEAKMKWILEMIPVLAQVGRTLVFVATRAHCQEMATQLEEKTKVMTRALHGDMHQIDRNAALQAFKKLDVSVLIATDVASRGLDVPNVSTVINFDVAKNLDAHVHRIGRAGRLSKDQEHSRGTAYTLLVNPKNADFAHVLLNSFLREGRQVSHELRALANKSRKSGNVASRNRHNKAGLGFHEDDPSSTTREHFSEMPQSKRSRWN